MKEPADSPEPADSSLRQVFDVLPLGILVFDASHRLLESNDLAARLMVLPPHLLQRGTPLEEFVRLVARRGDLGSGDPDVLAMARLAVLEQSDGSVLQRLGRGGPRVEIHSMSNAGGGLVITFADISSRSEAEHALAESNANLEARVRERTAELTLANAELEKARRKADLANRDKTRFLAAASHDLLQPLNAARLYTASLVERAKGSHLGELAQSIEFSLNAVEDIMSALLDISLVDSGTLTADLHPFRISDLIEKVAVEFGPLAMERGVDLRLVHSEAVVISDKALLARIVQNLVSNAIKYTNRGGRVLVGCRRRGSRIRLDVVDTGIGLRRDQQQFVFTEFARLERASRMAHGLGLGLSIVQRLATVLELTIEIDSVEDRGSRFSIALPAGRLVAQPAIERAEVPAPLSGLRVLCIDNEGDVLDAMAALLGGWDCELRSARSLKDLSRDQQLVGWTPDVVLMDYHLDQASGLDAVEWLRQNLGGHLPAVLVTADRSAQVRALAEARNIPIVTKPVKPAALRAAINGVVAKTLRGEGA